MAAREHPLNLYTIPATRPFLKTLADYLLKHYGDSPETLACVMVMLPSQRASVSLRETLLARAHGKTLLMPRMLALGSADENGLHALQYATGKGADIPPSMTNFQRHAMLTRLVQRFGRREGIIRVYHAAELALTLIELLDDIQREQIDIDRLDTLVPDQLAEHWQHTLDFLKIIRIHWPNLLAEEGLMDPIARRNRLLAEITASWQEQPPAYPVIVAGVGTYTPAQASLFSVIARMPKGMVILPGFEASIRQEEWECIAESHPYYDLKRLITHIGAEPLQVRTFSLQLPDTCPPVREEFLRHILQPAECMTSMALDAPNAAQATERMQYINCTDEREEARIICLKLRAVLEVPGKRAAVVTNDRSLARMVREYMRAYGIALDDSAGTPVQDTPAFHFLQLIIDCIESGFAPINLLALLKHPLAACGLPVWKCRDIARQMEISALRGLRLEPGLAPLRAALAAMPDTGAALDLLDRLQHAFAPLTALWKRESEHPLSRLIAAHVDCAEALAKSHEETGAARLWNGDRAAALMEAMALVNESAHQYPPLDVDDYAPMLDTLLTGHVYRPAYGTHPRLDILGLLEARLQEYDTVILAGLHEGSWPPHTEGSYWMSRPMMRNFGLTLPEARIGAAAHDFYMLSCAPEVIYTYAQKAGGELVTPSRFLQRMQSSLKAAFDEHPLLSPQHTTYHAWVSQLEAPYTMQPILAPAPAPPLFARPRRLSITDIETWQRDPYVIYAKHVLKLRRLEPLGQEPGAAEYGSIIHKAMELFCERYPDTLPPYAYDALAEYGREALAPFARYPSVAAIWWPRFLAAAHWIVAREGERREQLTEIIPERHVTWRYPTAHGAFELHGRIDRMETLEDGSFAVIDYKTGQLPRVMDIASGLACQLPLEAMMLQAADSSRSVSELLYWKLGGRMESNREMRIDNPAELVRQAESLLITLIETYFNENTPYAVSTDMDTRPAYNDYEHLERIEEWGVG